MKPKKERPSALPDSIFSASVPEQIPVHNTFIQFGAPQSPADAKKPPTTAPAWVGPSFQSIIHQASEEGAESMFASMEGKSDEPFFAPEDEDSQQEHLPLGSSQKVPMMRYALSSSSARAAGFPDGSAMETVGPPVSSFALDGEKVAENGSVGEAGKAGAARAATLGPVGSPLSAGAAAAALGPLPSMGSALHAEGSCKRCCFYPKGRCTNGTNCEFCHFEHEKRKRKKKKKRGAGAADNVDGSESDDESVDGAPPGYQPDASQRQPPAGLAVAGGARPQQPDPFGPMRSGLHLTAPPPLPPRDWPLPSHPPPPAPNPLGRGVPGADPYYGGGYDLGSPGGGGSPFAPGILGGYGGSPYQDGVPAGLGGVGINQSYFGGGYDPAAFAAQQQQAAYPQQPQGTYMPPPR